LNTVCRQAELQIKFKLLTNHSHRERARGDRHKSHTNTVHCRYTSLCWWLVTPIRSLHPLHVTPKPCGLHRQPDHHSRSLLAQFGLILKSRRGLAAGEVVW